MRLGVQLLIKAGCPVNLVKHRGRGEVPEYGIQPLHLSTYGGGYPEVARALLEAGASVNAAESNGRTTLHHAAIRNAHRIIDVLLEYNCDLDCIRLLQLFRCYYFVLFALHNYSLKFYHIPRLYILTAMCIIRTAHSHCCFCVG